MEFGQQVYSVNMSKIKVFLAYIRLYPLHIPWFWVKYSCFCYILHDYILNLGYYWRCSIRCMFNMSKLRCFWLFLVIYLSICPKFMLFLMILAINWGIFSPPIVITTRQWLVFRMSMACISHVNRVWTKTMACIPCAMACISTCNGLYFYMQ